MTFAKSFQDISDVTSSQTMMGTSNKVPNKVPFMNFFGSDKLKTYCIFTLK